MTIYNKTDLLAQRLAKIYENNNFEITGTNVATFIDDFIDSIWNYVDEEVGTGLVDNVFKVAEKVYTILNAQFNQTYNLATLEPDANVIKISSTYAGEFTYNLNTTDQSGNKFTHIFYVYNDSPDFHIVKFINSNSMDLSYVSELSINPGDWALFKGNVDGKTTLLADSNSLKNVEDIKNITKLNRSYYNWNDGFTYLNLTDSEEKSKANYIELNSNTSNEWEIRSTIVGSYTAKHKFVVFVPTGSGITGELINSTYQDVGSNNLELSDGDWAVMQGDFDGKTRLLYTNKTFQKIEMLKNISQYLRSEYLIKDATMGSSYILSDLKPELNLLRIESTTPAVSYNLKTSETSSNKAINHQFLVVNSSSNAHAATIQNGYDCDTTPFDPFVLNTGDWALFQGNLEGKTTLIASSVQHDLLGDALTDIDTLQSDVSTLQSDVSTLGTDTLTTNLISINPYTLNDGQANEVKIYKLNFNSKQQGYFYDNTTTNGTFVLDANDSATNIFQLLLENESNAVAGHFVIQPTFGTWNLDLQSYQISNRTEFIVDWAWICDFVIIGTKTIFNFKGFPVTGVI